MVYAHGLLIITAGALVIADIKFGGLLMCFAMMGFIITRDNPFLANSDSTYRMNLQNMLKDLAVAGAGIMIYSKRKVVVHRKSG